jgi:hypothetical protein
VVSFAEVIFIGLLAGCTWFQTNLTEQDVSKLSGFLFFMCAYWFFAGLYTGLLDFLPESLVVQKDHAAGAYRLSTYYISRTLGSIPARIVLPTVFAVIACLLAIHSSIYASSQGVMALVAVVFLLILTALTGDALGVFLGIACNRLDRSIALANVTALSMTIFGGFYIRVLPVLITWLRYFSVLKYCFDALCQVQFPSGAAIKCSSNGYYILACYEQEEISGDEVRRWLNVDSIPLGGNIAAIFGIYIILKVAGYIALLYNT